MSLHVKASSKPKPATLQRLPQKRWSSYRCDGWTHCGQGSKRRKHRISLSLPMRELRILSVNGLNCSKPSWRKKRPKWARPACAWKTQSSTVPSIGWSVASASSKARWSSVVNRFSWWTILMTCGFSPMWRKHTFAMCMSAVLLTSGLMRIRAKSSAAR